VLRLALFCCWWLAVPVVLHAQGAAEFIRRGAGVRVGFWHVEVAAGSETSRAPQFDLYLQRGLASHLAMENSLSVWWATSRSTQALPDAPEVTTRTYVVPLIAALKLYPLTSEDQRFEPFVLAGAGIAFGIEDQSESAIGGGGTTIVTGLGVRAGLGAELRLTTRLGFSASGTYQWMHFGEELGTTETYTGVGAAGGIIYRFQF
jgi:hypothetical protein